MRYLSIFSGMEAAHLAWSPLGWTCVCVAEVDPAPCALLRHRLPNVPNLGDVTAITDAAIAKLGRIDVVIGGSPCQDLSVAGKRAGLAGSRSSLFHEQLRIFDAARTLCGARWLVWENVPGAFSSNAGRDFAVVVGALAGCELNVPDDGWGNEGLALGDNGLVEWAVLDAQWFGVAQRRRRVFAVLDTGDWSSRPAVLLESDSLRGNSPPRREAGEGVAGTLSARTQGGGGLGTEFERQGGLIPDVSPTLRAGGNRTGGDRPPGTDVDTCESLIPSVAHTLRGDGFDASEDGTGRGTPLVPVMEPYTLAIRGRGDESVLEYRQDGTANALLTPSGGRCGINVGAIAFGCKDSDPSRSVSDDLSPTLRAMGHSDSHANAGGQVAVAFAQNQRDEVRQMEIAGALAAEPGMKQQTYLQSGMQVRRLTPIECERLQGAPDNWTLVPHRKGQPMADGPRYKMLGNSFAVPVIRWIGEQIDRAHHVELKEAA